MAQEPNLYDLYEKIGKTLAGIEGLSSKVSTLEGQQILRHEENCKKFDDIFDKVGDVKQRQIDNEVRILSEVSKINDEVKGLQKPVTEIVALRSKIGMFMAAVFAIGSFVSFLVQPVMSFASTHLDLLVHR